MIVGIEDMQLLNTIRMRLSRRRWQCVSGLKKCMDFNLPGRKCLFHKDTMSQGWLFWKIWLPNFTQKFWHFTENQQKAIMSLDKKCPKPHGGAEIVRARFGLSIPRAHTTAFCLTMLMDSKILNFLALILSCLPLLQEGTTSGIPAVGSSHIRSCYLSMIKQQYEKALPMFA